MENANTKSALQVDDACSVHLYRLYSFTALVELEPLQRAHCYAGSSRNK